MAGDDPARPKRALRSAAWFEAPGREGILHRSWLKNQGLPDDVFDGRPVIGICNTASDLAPCNAHLHGLAERVKRGVWEAGGFPLEFPVMSLGESLMRPSTRLFRNLASMDVEESIRANPIDGVVLLVGCDKTTPALLMGAASCDLPTIVLSGGPMPTASSAARTSARARCCGSWATSSRRARSPRPPRGRPRRACPARRGPA
jgi:L-arabonate dehydrase